MVSSPSRPQLSSPVTEVEQPGIRIGNNPASSFLALPTTPLFGTDGIRGKAGELLSASLALQVGFWAGQVLRASATTSGPVILGQDSRNSSDMLAMALAAGLTSAGLEVWNLGLCPTPCVAHLTSASQAVGGVMISASHNPPEDNGIKFFGSDGTKLPPALQQDIEAALRGRANFATLNGSWGQHYHRPELVTNYLDLLKRSLAPGIGLKGLRVVLDLAWGAAVHLAPAVFQEMGAEVICLHDRPDGDRINVNCGSTHLSSLQSAVKQHGADLGFAFDGDADRVMAVDAQGRVVDGDYILYFWGNTLRQAGQLPGDLIVATVMANLGFERAWKQLGGSFVRTAVGDQYVQAEMLRTGGKLGGEQSGHILCHHYSLTGDGLLTALHIAALVHSTGQSLSELIDGSFQTYPQLLRNVRVEDREKRRRWQECDAVTNAIAQAEAAMGDQGRILVRASGTEPVIRVMVEAASADLTNHWTEQLVLAVEQHLA
ncbi:phosphoglucosamine mutase [Coleofasciculus sp. FACHB-64]|uniref:phosphoglucosamine mutase n=1 Tax=Cyanophyceae TaxID=3028117 RepID=UPI001686282D|nr:MULTISPECIES: phosphoglucosamine mutase [unclassified Coleofasciculus]MBD1837198.1 phosphoglucosamine mutase [Coleofasciculus sp. FACHB-501]MBD1889658.1 phosphoglucosamine mutase [Coleofasciculus sp. FACHB-SPT9]MBD1898797.1 phosphoglucosamine mutase [Coleofasciculus sp. FACHB-125]MBD2045359.1 phosphoglucosamine mutase [Coleofasciculus sp. FACHB-64]MBD2083687.1 phosphoglucosamine mutase [Coleofasciculus sp. FACHB-542]